MGTKGMKNATHYSSNRQLVHADYCVRTQTVQYDSQGEKSLKKACCQRKWLTLRQL